MADLNVWFALGGTAALAAGVCLPGPRRTVADEPLRVEFVSGTPSPSPTLPATVARVAARTLHRLHALIARRERAEAASAGAATSGGDAERFGEALEQATHVEDAGTPIAAVSEALDGSPPSAVVPEALSSDVQRSGTPRATRRRAAPVTRRALSSPPQTAPWPALTGLNAGAYSEAERLSLLAELSARRHEPPLRKIMLAAFREEGEAGRKAALYALCDAASEEATAALVEALEGGCDAERSIAVERAAAIDCRPALRIALSDRLEALAARAAWSYAQTRQRAVFVERLRGCVEPARLEAILSLLAGILD